MIKLISISIDKFKERFHQFYQENTQYYMIVKDDNEVGIYGIINLDNKVCELAITIFKEYRHKVFSKEAFLIFINFPFSLNFNKAISWTKRKSWVKLMKSFEKDGINITAISPIDGEINEKTWFYKERKD